MADVKKTVSVSGKDDGLSSLFSKYEQRAKELSKNLFDDATKYSNSGKQQLQYIEDQIKATERRNKLQYDYNKMQIEEKYAPKLAGANALNRSKIEAQRDKELTTLNKDYRDDDLVARLLREEIETIKDSAKSTIREDKKAAEKEVGVIEELVNKGKLDEDPETKFKGAFMRMLLGDKHEDESNEKSKFSLSKKGVSKAAEQTSRILLQPNEIAMFAAAFASIPLVGSVMQKMLEEGSQLAEARGLARARTGRETQLLDVTDIGYTNADFYNYAGGLAKARGSSRANYTGDNLEKEAKGLLATQREYGLDEASIFGLAANQRFDTNRRGTFGDIQNQLGIFGRNGLTGASKGDTARVIELLQIQNQLVGEQTSVMEQINTDTNARVISVFDKAFDGRNTGQKLSTVNQSLRNPSTDFEQAFNYSILRRLNPQKSFFELQEEQEKGVAANGLLSETFKSIQRRGGSRDNQLIQIQRRLGLSAQSTRKLLDAFEKNPEAFERMTSMGSENLGLSEDQVMANASGNTSPLLRRGANLQNVAANAGLASIDYLDEKFTSLGKLISGDFGGSVTETTATVKELNSHLKTANQLLDKNNKAMSEAVGNKTFKPNR